MANETMTLIRSQTISTTGISQIDFTSIPQTYTDLVLTTSARIITNNGISWADAGMSFNDATTGYTGRFMYGQGSSATSGTDSTTYIPVRIANLFNTANTFSSGTVYIPNYTAAANKSVSIDQVTENSATAALAMITAALWSNTSAITKISFFSGEFVVGTSLSLYGVLKGSGGATVS